MVAVVAIIIGSLSFVACSKTDESTIIPESIVNKISNSNNPYNYIGTLHNEILDSVGCRLKLEIANFASISNKDSAMYTSFENLLWININDLMIKHFNSIMPEETLNSDEINALLTVRFTPENYDEISKDTLALAILERIFAPQYTSVETLLDSILSIEQNYLDPSVSDNVKAKILPMIAVLKYSLVYWSNVADTPSNPWYPLLSNIKSKGIPSPGGLIGKLRELWTKFNNNHPVAARVAVADAEGALVGAVFGLATPATVGSSMLITSAAYSLIGLIN